MIIKNVIETIDAIATNQGDYVAYDELGQTHTYADLKAASDRGFQADIVILDGSHDWLSDSPDLFDDLDVPLYPTVSTPKVVTRVKADASCATVSAASVAAKVFRDRLMEEYEDPGYGWASNKGYSSAAHIDALKRLGPSELHRRSWRLPGVES